MSSFLSLHSVALAAAAGALVIGCDGAPAARASRSSRIGETTAQACVSSDAHAKHAAASVACVACHPCGGAFGFGAAVTYPQGTTSAGGTFTPGTATTSPSCQVGCHSPLGSPAHTVSWNTPGPLACTGCHDVPTLLQSTPSHPVVSPDATRDYCQGCHVMTAHTGGTVSIAGHDATWMNPSDPGFHAFTANQGLGKCQGCHLPDLSGGATGFSCVGCHSGPSCTGTATGTVCAAAWGCTMCHGGTDNQTGAPPKATWGNAGDPIRVGAHTSHVTASAISPAFACSACHVTPADAFAPGHITSATNAEVVFGGIAIGRNVPAPTWSRASATCSSTYCHGATMVGGSTPDWTKVNQGQADCGTCHGVPPPAPHPIVDVTQGLARCSTCHPLTIDPNGVMIRPDQGGAHLNGTLEAMGHDQNWVNPASPEFHAFAVDRNIQGCTGCHGAQLDGGATGISCASCHDGTKAVAWGCTMCHGGTDNQTGAPPKALWGYAGDPSRGGGTADPLRVGAHTKHVASTLTTPIACGTCHVVPSDVFAAGHIDGNVMAEVTFGGTAVQGGASPAFDGATGRCSSTYCHGNYSGTFAYGWYDWGIDDYVTKYYAYAGLKAAPAFTDPSMTCGSCHGNPPPGPAWHSPYHGYDSTYRQCQLCHPDAYSETGVGLQITNPAQHLNGMVEVTPRWVQKCFNCH